jgi:hypothetical protein
MVQSRLKSGHFAPPSVTRNFLAQFSRQAQITQNCLFPSVDMGSPRYKVFLAGNVQRLPAVEMGWN